MTKTNYCSNCGRKIDPQVAYCQYCENSIGYNDHLKTLKVINKLGAPLKKGEWSLFIVGLLLVIFSYIFIFLDWYNIYFKASIFLTLGFLFLYTSINLKWRGVFLLILVGVSIAQSFRIYFSLSYYFSPIIIVIILSIIIIACGIKLIWQFTEQESVIGGIFAYILFLIDFYFRNYIIYFQV
jgi:hypothetical protein